MKMLLYTCLLAAITYAGFSSCSEPGRQLSSEEGTMMQLSAKNTVKIEEPLAMKQFRGCKAHQ